MSRMVRIAYIANVRLPTEKAHGIQIMQTCAGLVRSGASVTVYVPNQGNALTDDPFVFYGVTRIFEIRRLWCIDSRVLFWFSKPLWFWVKSITFSWSCAHRIRSGDADIWYVRDAIIAWISIWKRQRCVLELHTITGRKTRLLTFIWKRLCGIVTISRGIADAVVAAGVPENHLRVVPDGVALDQFFIQETQHACRRRLSLPLDEPIVVYTGHLYPWKGVETLIAAMRLIPETHAYIVGGTDEDSVRYQELCKEIPNVHIVGWQAPSSIPFWLTAADALILPNSAAFPISRLHTSPLKLFEYLAAGKPIIASDLPSLREIVTDREVAFVPPDDPRALADAIGRVLREPDFHAMLAEHAKALSRNFSWDARAEKILSFISSTCSTTEPS
ncbi:MAG: glycosyltransferase family 4 protein [Patescibacteria group bacterium]